MKLKTATFYGKQYEVEVHDNGSFSSVVGDGRIYANSLAELEEQLVKLSARRRLKIAVEYYDESGGLCVVTGQHAKTGRWLVRTPKGTVQVRTLPWDPMRPLSKEEEVEFTRLKEAARIARIAVEGFQRSHRLSPDRAQRGLDTLARAALEAAGKAEVAREAAEATKKETA